MRKKRRKPPNFFCHCEGAKRPWQSPVGWFLRLSNTNVIAFRNLFASKTIPFGEAVGAVPPEGSFLVPARKLPKKPAGEGLS